MQKQYNSDILSANTLYILVFNIGTTDLFRQFKYLVFGIIGYNEVNIL